MTFSLTFFVVLIMIMKMRFDICIFAAEIKILNGTGAYLGQFPFMVAIQKINDSYKVVSCSGSLITLRNILTAAHCYGFNFTRECPNCCLGWASVGVVDRKVEHPAGQKKRLRNPVMHPKYYFYGKKYPRRQYDIAVVEVESPFKETRYVAPIAIATRNLNENEACVAVGYGRQRDFDTQPTNVCLAWYDTNVVNEIECIDNMVCTHTPGKSTAPGDSGSPLIDKIEKPLLYGVLHGSTNRAQSPNYSICAYANAVRFRRWIIENSDLKLEKSGEARIIDFQLLQVLLASELITTVW